MKKYINISLTALVFLGCSNSVELKPASSIFIAEDFISNINKTYPPARTALSIKTKGKFEKELEEQLRAKGYEINNEAMPLVINIDKIGTNIVGTRFKFDNKIFSRAYYIDNNSTASISSWTIGGGLK